MAEPPVPDLRASDADREQVAERLRSAAGDGQLTVEELDERLHAAYAARTRRELEPLVADLQAPGGAAATPVSHAGGYTVRRGDGGARWIVSVLGGVDRRGRWRLAERAIALNVMGGSNLDLNQVELASEDVELTVLSIMGGSEIRVPKGLNVEVSEFGFLGGNDVDIAEDHPPQRSPVLRLRILSIMGGTDVKRGPKPSRAERRALKQQRRLDRRLDRRR
jgi:Domain of unknown function (DUF1707)